MNYRWVAAWTIVVAIGLALRLINLPLVFTNHGVEYLGTDAYYHALRTIEVARYFPHIQNFDPNLHYPAGAHILYPGGFHLLVASTAKLLFIADKRFAVETLCALFPLLLFLLNFALLRRTARRCFETRFAPLLCCLLYAILPAAVGDGSVGNFDHHPLESCFYLATLLAVIEFAGFKAPKASAVESLSPPQIALWGVLFGCMPFFWVQGTFFIACFVLAGLLLAKGKTLQRFVLAATVAAGVATLLTLVYGRLGKFSPNELTLTQPILTAFGAMLLTAKYKLSPKYWKVVVAVTTVLLLFLGWHVVTEISATLMAVNPFLQRATESRSLGLSNLAELCGDYGGMFLLVPPLLIWSVYRHKTPNNTTDKRYRLIAIWTLLALIMMIVQRRFATFFNITYPLAVLALVTVAMQRRYRLLPPLLALGCLPLAVFTLKPVSNSQNRLGFTEFRRACNFLQQFDASMPHHSNITGVLADWDTGHWVRYYCKLPSVTSPMTASREAQNWNAAASRLFYETDLDKLHAELLRYRVRYVIATLPLDNFQKFGEALGIKQQFLHQEGDVWYYDPPLFETLPGRLCIGSPTPPPRWLQLIYSSPTTIRVAGKDLPLLTIAAIDY